MTQLNLEQNCKTQDNEKKRRETIQIISAGVEGKSKARRERLPAILG